MYSLQPSETGFYKFVCEEKTLKFMTLMLGNLSPRWRTSKTLRKIPSSKRMLQNQQSIAVNGIFIWLQETLKQHSWLLEVKIEIVQSQHFNKPLQTLGSQSFVAVSLHGSIGEKCRKNQHVYCAEPYYLTIAIYSASNCLCSTLSFLIV